MFKDLVESYKALSLTDKRNVILQELKEMIAIYENVCQQEGISHREIKSREILDLKEGKELEEDYLEALFVYVKYLKEVSSAVIANR